MKGIFTKKISFFSLLFTVLFSMSSCNNGPKTASATDAVSYPQDTIVAKDGSQIVLTFYAHASVGILWNGHQMYFDPVGENIDWAAQPKADLIFITHDHYDHYDAAVAKILNGTGDFVKMTPGETSEPFEGMTVKAVPAYNITEGHLDFHPKERGDAGYIITMGGTTVYVAGDTEDNEDVLAIRDVDIAFLPVNQPYTMTIDQCVRVVEAIRPAIFYPYHTGGVDNPTDVNALKARLDAITDVRIRPME